MLANGSHASFCTAAPPPIPLRGLLMRTGQVGEDGWETWRRATESGGGGGVGQVEAGMMVEFRCESGTWKVAGGG